MGDNKKKLTVTISKVQNNLWKIKNELPNINSIKVSIPVVVYHNYRKNQSNNLKQLQSVQKTIVAEPEKSEPSPKNRTTLTNVNKNRLPRKRPINTKAAERKTQNSLIHNQNIAIGIVSLLQPDTIASIFRQNNVEIPMTSLNNTNNNVPNTDKDINNNDRSDASTGEPSLNTRDDDNTNDFVNVDNITRSNQRKTLHKDEDKVEKTKEREVNVENITRSNQTKTLHKEKGKVEVAKEREVKVLNMETQTDDLKEVDSGNGQKSPDEPVSGEQVPLEVPTAPTMDNTPRNCLPQEPIKNLYQLRDWNQFLLQTNMGRTHQDWFDPNVGKKNAPVQKSGQRKRKSTAIVEYDPDLFLTRHMMVNNPAGMSNLPGQQVPMSTAPVVPPMLMAPGYNTRSSQRLEPAYPFNQNIQYMPQQTVNMVPPMMYHSYQPNIHNPMPCHPTMTVTSTRGQTSKPRWHVPIDTQVSMNQFLEAQRQNTTAQRAQMTRAVHTDHMTHQTFIDDPRRRTRK